MRALALIVVAVVLAGTSPLWLHPRAFGGYDWGKELFDAAVAREACVAFREPPVWNRYCGGGNLSLGNPETFVASPLFLLVVLLGPAAGLKASIVLHALLGATGMARLLARRGLNGLTAAFGATCWALTGHLAIHLAVGHVQWQALFLLPWVIAPWLATDGGGHAAAAAALALMVLDGGVHGALIAGTALLLLAAAAAARAGRFRPLALGVATVGVAMLLCGVRLIPAQELLAVEPHRVATHAGFSPRLLLQALFVSTDGPAAFSPDVDTGEGGGYWEYGSYVGVLLLPLLFADAMLSGRRERAAPFLLGAIGIVLALELPAPLSPWKLLHRVPPFTAERRPGRFVVLLVLAIVVLASHGLARLRERRPRLALLLALAALLDLGIATRAMLASAVVARAEAPAARAAPPFELVAGGSSYRNFLDNRGTLPCRQGLHLPQRAVARGDRRYRGEAYLEGEGTARLVGATSRSLVVRYEAPAGGLVVVNQNDFGGWRVEGGERAHHDGLVAARVAAGSGEVRFFVSARRAALGLLVSLLALPLLVPLARVRPRATMATGAEPSVG